MASISEVDPGQLETFGLVPIVSVYNRQNTFFFRGHDELIDIDLHQPLAFISMIRGCVAKRHMVLVSSSESRHGVMSRPVEVRPGMAGHEPSLFVALQEGLGFLALIVVVQEEVVETTIWWNSNPFSQISVLMLENGGNGQTGFHRASKLGRGKHLALIKGSAAGTQKR